MANPAIQVDLRLKDFLSDEIKKATASFNKFAKKTEQDMGAIRRSADAVKGTIGLLGTAFAALGAGYAIRGLTRLVTSTSAVGDELAKMAQKVGVGVDVLSEFRYAGELADVNMQQLSVGLGQLARNANDASRGMGVAKDTFKSLDIAVVDSDGKLRAVKDLLLDVADRFSRMEDGTAKTAAAMELFGRSGKEMIPLLNEGRDGLEKMAEASKNLRLGWTEADAKAAEAFNDAVREFQFALEGIRNEIVKRFFPSLTDKFKSFTQLMAGDTGDVLIQAFQRAFQAAGDMAVKFGEVLASGIGVALDGMQGLIQMSETYKTGRSTSLITDTLLSKEDAFSRGEFIRGPDKTAISPTQFAGSQELRSALLGSKNTEDLFNNAVALQKKIDSVLSSFYERQKSISAENAEDIKKSIESLLYEKSIIEEFILRHQTLGVKSSLNEHLSNMKRDFGGFFNGTLGVEPNIKDAGQIGPPSPFGDSDTFIPLIPQASQEKLDQLKTQWKKFQDDLVVAQLDGLNRQLAQLDQNLAGQRDQVKEFLDSGIIGKQDYEQALSGIENSGQQERLRIATEYAEKIAAEQQKQIDDAFKLRQEAAKRVREIQEGLYVSSLSNMDRELYEIQRHYQSQHDELVWLFNQNLLLESDYLDTSLQLQTQAENDRLKIIQDYRERQIEEARRITEEATRAQREAVLDGTDALAGFKLGIQESLDEYTKLGRVGAQAGADIFHELTSITGQFRYIIDGTRTVEDAFRDMGLNIITTLAEVLVRILAVKAVMGIASAFGGGALSGVGSASNAAEGTVIPSPMSQPNVIPIDPGSILMTPMARTVAIQPTAAYASAMSNSAYPTNVNFGGVSFTVTDARDPDEFKRWMASRDGQETISSGIVRAMKTSGPARDAIKKTR